MASSDQGNRVASVGEKRTRGSQPTGITIREHPEPGQQPIDRPELEEDVLSDENESCGSSKFPGTPLPNTAKHISNQAWKGKNLLLVRPRGGGASSNRKKRKKVGVDRIASALNSIASAIKEMVNSDPAIEICKKLTAVIDPVPGIDFMQKFRVKRYLMDHKNSAILFLEASEEDKPKMLEIYMAQSEDGFRRRLP